MEVKEAERVVIAKPVPSRPSCSGFRPFTELLVDSVNVSPPNGRHDTVVAAIRPKTVRFRPTAKTAALAGFASSRDESAKENGKASGERGMLDSKSYVIYKPKAMVVSKATVSVLANMEKFGVNQQQPWKQTEACVQNVSQDRWNFQNHLGSNLPLKVPSFAQGNATTSSDTLIGDRSSQDGYHWRKYGQKQVKGSEFPRGYFRCTYPNCPVKKKVERSSDGQISEIVYQGEHNHQKPCPPPPPPRRSSSNGSKKLGLVSEGSFGQDPVVYHSMSNRLNERNDVSESRVEDRIGVGVTLPPEFVAFGATTSAAGTSDSCCPSGEFDESGKGLDGEVDEPRTKRRKTEGRSSEAGMSEESSGEARGQPQSSVDSEALEDGFRWRKYGQKVVRGNPFPRSYYKCTSRNCGARKHVERASDDPRAFITTYEGKHNHQIPSRTTHMFSSQEHPK